MCVCGAAYLRRGSYSVSSFTDWGVMAHPRRLPGFPVCPYLLKVPVHSIETSWTGDERTPSLAQSELCQATFSPLAL